jgi:predicted transcriptional regulator
MTIDERIEQLIAEITATAPLRKETAESIRKLAEVTSRDAQNIRALLRVAESRG